jgi:hypothetical protein
LTKFKGDWKDGKITMLTSGILSVFWVIAFGVLTTMREDAFGDYDKDMMDRLAGHRAWDDPIRVSGAAHASAVSALIFSALVNVAFFTAAVVIGLRIRAGKD